MEAEFILNPSEEGFIIVMEEDSKYKYLGKKGTSVSLEVPLMTNVESEALNGIILYEHDEDGILEDINELRGKGIAARMYSVFSDNSNRILDNDETAVYIRLEHIITIK